MVLVVFSGFFNGFSGSFSGFWWFSVVPLVGLVVFSGSVRGFG